MLRLPSRSGLLLVTAKELVGSFRDRQTAIYTLVLPICMYPIMFWLMIQAFLVVQGQRERTEVSVRVAEARPDAVGAERAELVSALEGEALTPGAVIPERVRLEPWPGTADPALARTWVERGEERAQSDAAERPDAALLLGVEGDGGAVVSELYYDSSRSRSQIARGRIESRLEDFAARFRARAARKLGRDPGDLAPIEVQREDVAPRSDKGALLLSSVLPMLLVVMAVMGAFFPAVDLTAGEKERGTAETTLLLPIPRSTVHQAKILAVSCTAVVATFLNLLAIGVSAKHLISMLTDAADVRIELPVLALVSIVPLALLFAFFTSAVLTSVAGLSATFKEGQALLGPVQIVFILPALIGLMPGLELDLGLAFVPIINVVLAFRSMLVGKPLYLEYAATAGALLLYAWIAIRVAARLLSRESVLLAGATIPLRRFLSTLKGAGGAR